MEGAVLEAKGKFYVDPLNRIDLKTYLRSKSLIKGDPDYIKEVVVNIILNAVEAMPDGGEIHLTTEGNKWSQY